MHDKKSVPIAELMDAAKMELIRLDFKSSTLSRHSKEFRNFSNDCKENKIYTYDSETGSQYFQRCYGLDIPLWASCTVPGFHRRTDVLFPAPCVQCTPAGTEYF